LGDNFELHEFQDMNHGFVSRGDLKNPVMRQNVKKAMLLAVKFLKKVL